jgi:hypothetical protein
MAGLLTKLGENSSLEGCTRLRPELEPAGHVAEILSPQQLTARQKPDMGDSDRAPLPRGSAARCRQTNPDGRKLCFQTT